MPPLLLLELVNVAGRQWGWDEGALLELLVALDDLGLEVAEADLSRVARWTARGLTAYDATYVALAEERGAVLVTTDRRILAVAGPLARPLVPGA